ncbi:MAG: hypothetical protein H8D53_04465 [Bacteroidetes bacterium]|jgi:hypothetical protein|nr:hypothetical protein [Bacteroidota bacterium]
MEEQIQMYQYRLEAIVKRVSGTLEKLEKLKASSGNMSYDQENQLISIIKDLKEIQ